MTIDLDALEKLADEAEKAVERIDGGDGWTLTHQGPDEFYGTYPEIGAAKFFGPASEEQSAFTEAASPATIKALIAELKEARGLLQRWRSDLPTEALEDITDAFLSRNGKGEG